MRNFDTWNRYSDNAGNPLHGCVMFNVKGGNTVAPIYDKDGTPLSNPILTDIYGRTEQQVFIDRDITAYFYKYIGEGTYTSPTDDEDMDEATIDVGNDELWYLQYTIDSSFDDTITVTGDSAMAVPTISALRNIDVDSVPLIDGQKVVTLLGYNTVGDKEFVNYVWDPIDNTSQDDGGSVIKSSPSTGRWKLVKPTEHCDCRHFGIFPSNSTGRVTDNTSAIIKWISYCNTARIKPYFSATGDYVYYKYQQIYVVSNNEIDVANGVQFIDNGSTNTLSTPKFNGNPLFRNNNTKLITNFAKASWNGNVISKANSNDIAEYVVDAALPDGSLALVRWDVDIQHPVSGLNMSNCNVKGTSVVTNSEFYSCEINSVEILGSGNSFTDTTLKAEMFDNVSSVSGCTGCPADIQDFRKNIPLYLDITGKQGQINYDWQDVVPTAYCNVAGSAVDADRVISNFSFYGAHACDLPETENVHTYTFVNCHGKIGIQASAANVYRFIDCTCTVSVAGYMNEFTLIADNSNITLSQNLTAALVTARDSALVIDGNRTINKLSIRNSELYVSGNVNVDEFSSYSSILVGTGKIVSFNTTVKNTQINFEIDCASWIPVSGDPLYNNGNPVVNCFFDNNVFNARNVIVTDETGDTVIIGTWVNNIGNVPGAVVIDKSSANLDQDDTHHAYVYKNNSGTMEMASDIDIVNYTKLDSLPISDADLQANEGLPGYVICCPNVNGTDSYRVIATTLYEPDGSGDYYDDRTKYFSTANFFTVGTVNCRVNVGLYLEDKSSYFSHSDVGYIKYGNAVAGNAMLRSTDGTETTANCSVKYDIAYDFTQQTWKIKNITIGDGIWNNLPSAVNPLKLHIVQF